MGFGTGFAIYFIIWWVALFVVLPFGLRTQYEAGEVVPGTVASAPANFSLWRIVVRTTIVSGVVFAVYLGLTMYFGYSMEDLMALAPDFSR